MELNLQRPLLFFDIESTGLNIPVDSIVELSFVKVFPGGEQRIKTWRIGRGLLHATSGDARFPRRKEPRGR